MHGRAGDRGCLRDRRDAMAGVAALSSRSDPHRRLDHGSRPIQSRRRHTTVSDQAWHLDWRPGRTAALRRMAAAGVRGPRDCSRPTAVVHIVGFDARNPTFMWPVCERKFPTHSSSSGNGRSGASGSTRAASLPSEYISSPPRRPALGDVLYIERTRSGGSSGTVIA